MVKLLVTAAMAVLFSGSASAAITFTTTNGTPAGDTIIENFDAPISAGFSFTPTQPGATGTGYQTGTYTGDVSGFAAPPSGDKTTYFAVLGGSNSSATLTSTNDLSALSLEIGSLDAYNMISFYSTSGALIQSFTGAQLAPILSNDYFNFVDTSGYFSKVVFASGGNSMEIDNIAVAAAPEPATWVMMFAGVAMVGGMLRFRRRGLLAQA